MIKGTFCDWLMIHTDLPFNNKCVIVEATDIVEFDEGLPDRPIFDEMFIEQQIGGNLGKMQWGVLLSKTNINALGTIGHRISLKRAKEFLDNHSNSYLCVVAISDMDYKRYSVPDLIFLAAFSDEGSMMDMSYLLSSAHGKSEQEASEGVGLAVKMISSVGQCFHKRAEIELVDWPRNFRRRQLRKTGKEPSPYFRIINPEAAQKRYEGDKPSQKTGIKMPLHIVRGHFRHVIDHPIEHFNGTRWIQSHTRGDKKLGAITKGYTIRLPEASAND